METQLERKQKIEAIKAQRMENIEMLTKELHEAQALIEVISRSGDGDSDIMVVNDKIHELQGLIADERKAYDSATQWRYTDAEVSAALGKL